MRNSLLAATCISAIFFVASCSQPQHPHLQMLHHDGDRDEQEEQKEENRMMFVKDRLQHEFMMLKDPVSGRIPADIRMREWQLARQLPYREYGRLSGTQDVQNLNTYTPAGPNNIGGRTRAVAFDRRYNGSTNKVIIAGSVSGGIFRSSDGGNTWTRVNPENDIHNLTALAQDPNNPDTWYAGGGEPIANSASSDGASYLGYGIWKSTNNGQTWTKLTQKVMNLNGTDSIRAGTLENFDGVFDFVHRIYVNPANSDVYICGHRRLIRSTDAGSSWREVFTTATAASSSTGQMDITGNNAGKLFLAVNGGMPDAAARGIWTSTSGNSGSWTRIAGGSVLGVDSVDGWQGNDPQGNSRRIILAAAPNNQDLIYVTYENGKEATGSSAKPEVDLYKYNSATKIWTNLSANVPDFPGQKDGVDPFTTQGGYNLTLVVKPDDSNAVFLGGVNLFRSTNGFSNSSGTTWIGGYGKSFTNLNIYGSIANSNDPSKWSHPDIHNLVFDPGNPSRAVCANDGGLQITQNIMATGSTDEPVSWANLSNYQTLQYYHVTIDPEAGELNFIGGAQDNGTRFRDGSNLFGDGANNNNHFRIGGGDGGTAAVTKTSSNGKIMYGTTQYGNLFRIKFSSASPVVDDIEPSGLTATPGYSDGHGDFVTYFIKDFDNDEDLYYVNFNRVFRTSAGSSVTSSTGWTEITGIASAIPADHQEIINSQTYSVTTNITALELSRGTYFPSHALYIGTNQGRLYRFDNPRNGPAATQPVDITPPFLANLANNRTPVTISDIAVNPNNDEEVMLVVSNYGTTNIWWTNNAKNASPTWKNAEGNLTLPSIRSCAIVVKKDDSNNPVTEYYVGTSVGLFSAVNIGTTVQGGGSVSWVREGGNVLNLSIISSLDYRPEDNVLLVGTHGNGMYYAQVGTADYHPNQNTGINDPVRNDKNFIVSALPTVAVKDQIQYRIGNMYTIRSVLVQVHNLAGQLLLRESKAYQDGSVNLQKLPPGAYVLSITSDDYKQQFVQKFVKN